MCSTLGFANVLLFFSSYLVMWLIGLDDGLNAYERSLVVKAKLRDDHLKKWIAEQTELQKSSDSNKKYIIVYPMNSGFGNNLAILAEGILMSMMTHRQLLSMIVHSLRTSLQVALVRPLF